MIRRFGTLGVGALLTLSLGTGCVATGSSTEQIRSEDARPQQAQPQPVQPPSFVVPKVTENPSTIAPPPPPETGDIEQSKLSSPPDPLPLIHVAHAPAEVNEPPVLLAMRNMIDKHPNDALEALQTYDKRTQELLLVMLPLAARVSEGGLDKASPEERAALLEQLDQLTTALRGQTPLSVEKMCYCRRISNYGMYDPLPDDHLFAGGDRKHGELVQLYVEARHFANRLNGKLYDTALASKLEITDKNNQLVVRMDFPGQPDRSLSPRQDYFIHYQFYVPARMEPGEYTLTITLRDDNATGDEALHKATRTMPFHVGGATPRVAHP